MESRFAVGRDRPALAPYADLVWFETSRPDIGEALGAMGYKFQFVTLSGFHALNHSMFQLATDYAQHGMTAYAELQDGEFAAESQGYEATKHQQFVGAGYFDAITQTVTDGRSSTLAMDGSTEQVQFQRPERAA